MIKMTKSGKNDMTIHQRTGRLSISRVHLAHAEARENNISMGCKGQRYNNREVLPITTDIGRRPHQTEYSQHAIPVACQ